MIFIEKDKALSDDEINIKLDILRKACATGNDNVARDALKSVVPTFRSPEEINKMVGNEVKQDAYSV